MGMLAKELQQLAEGIKPLSGALYGATFRGELHYGVCKVHAGTGLLGTYCV